MKRPLTDHEYQINGGIWTGCTSINTTDNGDGTYLIHDGLNIDIPINGLKIRVKSIGNNPVSNVLSNIVPFTSTAPIKKVQLLFFGDSITGGIGTTSTGSSQSGDFNKGNDYPTKTVNALIADGLSVTQNIMPFPGQTASWFNTYALNDALKQFDYINYTDIYSILFFGANDMIAGSAENFEATLTSICAALRAAGAKVIIIPVLNRKDSFSSPAFNQRRNQFNSSILANYATIADTVIDISGHPEMWGDDAPDNSTYFNALDSDGLSKVHPTDAGAQIIADVLAEALTTLSLTPSLVLAPPDEAADFITATGISDNTQIAAIQAMVMSFKASGLWWKLRAIYPFVGGTSETHKYNLKDSRDLDSCYRLTYVGSPTHDSNGITTGGGSKADTKFTQNMSSKFTLGKLSLSFYSKTESATSEGIDIGATEQIRMAIKIGANAYTEVNCSAAGALGVSYTALGLFTTSRADSTIKRSFYRNGKLITDTTSGDSVGGYHDQSILIGGERFSGANEYPSNRTCAYAAIGYGLTAAEEAAHYTIVQAYQTALGRNV